MQRRFTRIMPGYGVISYYEVLYCKDKHSQALDETPVPTPCINDDFFIMTNT